MKEVHRVRFEVAGILLSIFFILPFYWMAQTSTKDVGQLMQGTFLPGRPNHFIHDNLIDLFAWENGVFSHWLTNSFIYAGVGSVVGTFFAAMAGFAFRRYRFFGRKILFIVILGFIMVPEFATALPLFIEFKNFHFLNTPWAFIVPSVLSIFGVYLMVVYWNQVPEEMFDAAMMDGARDSRIFLRIGLPVIMPGLTTLLILHFVGIWNNYFLSLIMLSDLNLFPLILGITTINNNSGTPLFNLVMMGAFLTTLPLLVIFLALQKFLAPKLAGGVK